MAGSGPDTFNEPCDVITAPNGDIFVSDGHSGQNHKPPPGATGRIMKFTKDGKFIKEWGRIGSGPGEFRTPHALAFDSRGRLFVADRGNHRIQIFDQDGKFIDAYAAVQPRQRSLHHAGRHAVRDRFGNQPTNHPGWRTGVRIGKASEDKVIAFIPGIQSLIGRTAPPVKAWPSIATATCTRRKGRSHAKLRAED